MNGGSVKHWTVSEITAQIRGVIEPAFSNVWIKGEISNFRPAASGHVYFSLKDAGATISVAIFGWSSRKKTFELKDGLQVLCHGRISLYSPRGSYQLAADQVEPIGEGALRAAFEALKARLSAEGFFDQSRKRNLPRFPLKVAVVTSPSGAVIQDILNIMRRRAPHVRVVVVPVLVQGDGAADQIVRGLELVNKHLLGEMVILARGGGSIEDLWCFNEEKVARAIAASGVPVVSAIGHETDFTISDFTSDLRAPTPSAAAEIITGHWVDAAMQMKELGARLQGAIIRDLATRKTLLSHIAARLISPRDRLREQMQKCDELWLRLGRALKTQIDRRNLMLERLAGKLDALSPLKVLERGYSIVRDSVRGSEIIRSAAQISSGQELEITFYDGKKGVRAI
ncbi:MAG: exodeoxyribonuclease VII large subunit [Bdellovibrionota bacterium]